MTDGELDELRQSVARHRDKAKARPLIELGAALTERYWRAGPGSPGARQYLHEGIGVLCDA